MINSKDRIYQYVKYKIQLHPIRKSTHTDLLLCKQITCESTTAPHKSRQILLSKSDIYQFHHMRSTLNHSIILQVPGLQRLEDTTSNVEGVWRRVLQSRWLSRHVFVMVVATHHTCLL